MYTMSHPVSASLNGGGMGASVMEGGTINPAALNSSVLSGAPSANAPQPGPRGIKRSRSPDGYGDAAPGERVEEDDSKPRKRGRPPKVKVGESPRSSAAAVPTPQTAASQHGAPPVQTPQLPNQSLPQTSPSQVSPPKSTPTKSAVVKALPTVRDHTTDQLNPEGDEYIPREIDEAGEKKVAPNGAALDGREYICRTFFLPNRADKLFMLATECARNLNYRDSYLLFNKNRSLFKIIATQPEKDHLIAQDVLPYSYRSRQIAIVTARSMYRQFGSRLIVNGRRVRDDYWESKARKQGFTEEDAAGEKRPGAAKRREAAAAEATHAHALTALPHGEIIYSNGPAHMEGHHGIAGMAPGSLAPLPMINLAPNEDVLQRDYGNVQRPRQEISGPAYQDRSQPSSAQEILNQAAQTAEFNRTLGQQRTNRSKYLGDYWNRPHESPQRPSTAEGESVPSQPQAIQSPPMGSSGPMMGSVQQPAMPSQSQPQMMSHPGYTQQAHTPNPMTHSPIRPMHQQLRPEQMHHRTPGMNMAHGGAHGQTPPSYGYPQNPMWHAQPQPSPLSQSHHSMQQYAPPQQQPSPHPQQSPLHAPPQLHHSNSGGSMHGQPMGYQGMAGMGGPVGYSNVNRNIYQQHSPSPQQFMHQSSPAPQPGLQGWAPGQPGPGQQQQWQGGF